MAEIVTEERKQQIDQWFDLYPQYYQERYPVNLLFNLYYYVKNGKPTYPPERREMSCEYITYYQDKESCYQGIARYMIYNSAIFWKEDLNSYKNMQERMQDLEKQINNVYQKLTQSTEQTKEDQLQLKYLQEYQQSTNFYKTSSSLKLKFDIGPLYQTQIAIRKTQPKPQERELVFDIDSDDYTTVRGCGCKGSQMCSKCWRFMECACCIMQLFCEAYGFKKYFFDFSGRRGMHCWICDKEARVMQADQREALLLQYDLVEENDSRVQINLEKACFNHLEIILVCHKFFQIMRREQNWDNQDPEYNQLQKRILKDLYTGTKESIWKKYDARKQCIYEFLWDQCKTDKIQDFPETIQELIELFSKESEKEPIFTLLCKYIIYKTYPRFDINVTKTMNHLLKLPFSVHSKSLWISLPFDHTAVVRKYKLQNVVIKRTNYQNSPGQFEFITPEQRQQEQYQNQNIVGIKSITDDITPEVNYFRSIVSNILEEEQPQNLI